MPKGKQSNTRSLYFSNRITKAMNEIFNYPLAIIEAPMGYGKTTAVRTYLNNSDVNVLWLRAYDNSLISFWNNFAKLFYDIDNNRSQSLSQVDFHNDAFSIQEVVQLIEDIKFPEKTVLVIDDYHLIDSSLINSFIMRLAEIEIEHLHIVITARFLQFEKLEELSLKGVLYHISKKSFELQADEIMGYYRACGVFITEEQANQLYSITEGWISALYLMLLEYITDGSLKPPENIYKLMDKAIYASLSDEMKAFITTMSIFDSFTLKQAKSMWSKKNTGRLIAEITNKNAFVNYDSKSKIYHIHSLYREYLQEILQEKEPDYINNLYHRAGQWYLETGSYGTARHFFYLCGDFENLLSSMEVEKANNFTLKNKETLKKYIWESPPKIRARHPYALFILTIHLFVHNEIKLFYQVCKEIEDNLQSDESLTEVQKKQFRGELQLLYGILQYNDLKKMSMHFNKAWELLGRPTAIYEGLTDWNMGSPSILCLYHRQKGKLKEEVEDIIEIMKCYDCLTNGHGSGGEYLMEAEWYFNMGDFENAEISLYKSINRAKEVGNSNILICTMFLQIRFAFIRGDAEEIFLILGKMREQITEKSKYQVVQLVAICEIGCYSYLDQTVRIPKIIMSSNHEIQLRFFTLPMFNIVYGRLFLNGGEYLKLIGSAEQFLSVASDTHNLLSAVYIYIYLAAANYRIARVAEAEESLKKALNIAMPDRLYMPFVENCDYIEPLLNKFMNESGGSEDIANIMMLNETYKRAKEKVISAYNAKDQPKLTEREMEIARLAADGATNKEIAKQLYISVNTVKTMLKSVYSKLSINSRALLKQHIENQNDA